MFDLPFDTNKPLEHFLPIITSLNTHHSRFWNHQWAFKKREQRQEMNSIPRRPITNRKYFILSNSIDEFNFVKCHSYSKPGMDIGMQKDCKNIMQVYILSSCIGLVKVTKL